MLLKPRTPIVLCDVPSVPKEFKFRSGHVVNPLTHSMGLPTYYLVRIVGVSETLVFGEYEIKEVLAR